MKIPIFEALLLTSLLLWNTCFISSITTSLSSGVWTYMLYFDDVYNYKDTDMTVSLRSLSWDRVMTIISHQGLNVYEPVGSVLKSIEISAIGHNTASLRLVSYALHVFTGVLLAVWLTLLFRSVCRISFTVLISMTISLASVFVVHPLNVEVIGWLSAQSYTLALCFALMSCICFENVIVRSLRGENTFLLEMLSSAFYCASCLSKAPAIMLPAILLLRVLLISFSVHGEVHNEKYIRALYRYFGVLALFGSIMVYVITSANTGGTNNALVSFNSVETKLIRAMVTVWSFAQRILMPNDLRVHYTVEEEHIYSISGLFANNSSTLYPCVLITATTCTVLAVYPRLPFVTFSWLSLLVWWLPCVGLVNHGWDILGADRYCYFPIAFLVPGVLEIAIEVFIVTMPSNNTFTSRIQTKRDGTSSSDGMIRGGAYINHICTERYPLLFTAAKKFLFVIVLFGFLAMYEKKFIIQLESWRTDKTLLSNCLKIDPTDSVCHDLIGDWYGHHEGNEELGLYHKNLSMTYLPKSGAKSQLYRAMTLFQFGDQTGGCTIYDELYKSIQDIPLAYHPYILNNYVICHAIREGISISHREMALKLLKEASAAINKLKHVPKYVVDGISDHIDVISSWDDGRSQYGVSLLF